MNALTVIVFGEVDSRDKAIARLEALWGKDVVGSSPGFLQISITEVCTDLEKAKQLCRLYGGKPVETKK